MPGLARPAAGRPAAAAGVAALEARLGYAFRQPALLEEALIHPTWANESGQKNVHYQRLELLGDAVLDLLVSQMLYLAFPAAQEGQLSRWRASVVCAPSLANLARALHLGAYLRLGQGQQAAGASDGMLADVFEAVLGAVFLDAEADPAGGYARCRTIYGPRLEARLAEVVASATLDAKTALQELCHQRGLLPPDYAEMSVDGPAHARVFTIRAQVTEQAGAVPCHQVVQQGSSKKAAEQAAAKHLLALLTKG